MHANDAMGVMQAQPSTHIMLLQGEKCAHFFADVTGKTNDAVALLCLQQLVLCNVFIRHRQHRLRTPSAQVTISLLIADYSTRFSISSSRMGRGT